MRPTPLFRPGRLIATPGAAEVAGRMGYDAFHALLGRHLTGDWGTVDDHDKETNDAAVMGNGGRITSQYGEGPNMLWFITEANRSVTTVMRPDEY